jgi:hypothetical protein
VMLRNIYQFLATITNYVRNKYQKHF